MPVETQAAHRSLSPAPSPTERAVRPQTASSIERAQPIDRSSLRSSSLNDNLFAGIEQVPLELVGPFPQSEPHGPPFAGVGSSHLVVDVAAGADGGAAFTTDVSRPPAPSGDGNGTPLVAISTASPFSAVLPATDSATAASAPAGASSGSDSGGGSGGSGGPLDNQHGHHHRPSKNGDPLWVLDLNDRIVLPAASTVPTSYAINTYSTWSMNLYAQVSGATVQSYRWTLTGNDFTNVTGQTTANLQFTWRSFGGTTNDSDTVSLTTTNVGGGGDTQTFHFNVLATGNPGYQAARPTTAPTFPFVVPPDAVKPGQAMIDEPYYSLGEQTGEVRTSFTLPTYNPGIAPLQLDYSSTAANPEPIFTEFYQLSLPITSTSTVTATLKLNGVTQQTASYDTHLLNDGDIVDVALQGNAAGLSTGRYGYEIDLTENTTARPALTGNVDIVNESASRFGAGWSLANVYQVVPVSGGAIVVLPYGASLWFASSGPYTFTTPPGDFSSLVQNSGDLSYTLTLQDQTRLNFNSSGYQTSIVVPFTATTGNTFTFVYNPSIAGQLISITDFENRVITFGYTPGKVTITDPDLVTPPSTYRATQLSLDATHNFLTSITDPAPGYSEPTPSFHYTYDSLGGLQTLTDPRQDLPSNNVFTFAYNFANRIDTVHRPDGHVESLNAQAMNGLQNPQNPDHSSVLVAGAVAEYQDPRTTEFVAINWFVATDWYGFGTGLQSYDPLGDLTTDRRDPNGLTWLAEDPLSRATRTFYDQGSRIVLPAPQGDATEVVLPDGTTETYTFNNYNEPTEYTDPNGYTATYGYGGTSGSDISPGSLLTDVKCPCNPINNPQAGEYQLSYNQHGYQKTFTDPNNNTVTLTHGTYDNLAGVRYPRDGSTGDYPTVTMTYNSAGDRLSYEDALANTTSFLPDNLGRYLNQVAPTGGTISVSYDAAGNVTQVEDPVQNVTTYQYDPLNWVDQVLTPGPSGALTTSYTRDADGNVTDIVDPDVLPDGHPRHRQFVYDNAGRLTQEKWLDGTTLTYQANYTYDAASELTAASDQNASGATISAYTFSYNARGFLTSTQENTSAGVGVTLTDQYDANGNRTRLADNLPQPGTIGYHYTPGNQVDVEELAVGGAHDDPFLQFYYDSQDPADRLTAITATASLTNWLDTYYTYTNRNLVSAIEDDYPNNGSVVFTYTYDLNADVQTYSGPDGSLSYGYDGTGQLTAVYGSHPESYSYDLNGNRRSANGVNYGTPGPANQLTSDGVYTYQYDNVGNLVSKTGLEQGITTVYSFSWDFQNRLVEAMRTQNGGQTVLADDHFTYDVFGRRIGKLDHAGNQLWTVYDGVNPYADFTGTTSLALTTRYLYGPGVDQLLASTHADGNSTVWYVTDLLGSVRRVIGDQGTPLATVAYDSYGNSIPGSTLYNRFTYTGREWDSEINLYYYRGRYYDPNTGRFVSQDLLGLAAQDSNLYRYVGNNPTNAADPTGLYQQSVVQFATRQVQSLLTEEQALQTVLDNSRSLINGLSDTSLALNNLMKYLLSLPQTPELQLLIAQVGALQLVYDTSINPLLLAQFTVVARTNAIDAQLRALYKICPEVRALILDRGPTRRDLFR